MPSLTGGGIIAVAVEANPLASEPALARDDAGMPRGVFNPVLMMTESDASASA